MDRALEALVSCPKSQASSWRTWNTNQSLETSNLCCGCCFSTLTFWLILFKTVRFWVQLQTTDDSCRQDTHLCSSYMTINSKLSSPELIHRNDFSFPSVIRHGKAIAIPAITTVIQACRKELKTRGRVTPILGEQNFSRNTQKWPEIVSHDHH